MNIHIFFLQGVLLKPFISAGGYQEGVPIIFAPIPTSQLRAVRDISINSQMGLEY